MIDSKIIYNPGVTTDDGVIQLGGTTGRIAQFHPSNGRTIYFTYADAIDPELPQASVSVYREDFEVVND